MDQPRNSPRAVIYLRQSLDATGEGLAVARQREQCEQIARERGWRVMETYVDNSVSASDRRKARPAYDRMVADHAAGLFDALVCWDLDRLTRQPRQLEDWIDAAEQRGLRLVTANGEADLTTDGGRMFARVKAAVARAEIERKAARQRLAAAQRADRGLPPLGPRLTGYTSRGELVEEEAALVAEAFARFAAGDSLRSLAASLDDAGVPTRRGGRWNPSSVATMLANPRYAGRAVYNGQETGKRGGWTPVVSDDLFAVVQARLADPGRRTQKGTDRKHLGSGLFVCDDCGTTPMVSWSGGRYRCPDCGLNRSGTRVDEWVLTVVRARLGRADLADLLPGETDGRARELVDRLAALRRRLERVESDYDADLIDGRRYRVSTDRVREEVRTVEAGLARLGGGPSGALASVAAADDPVAAFDAAPLMIQRAVIDGLVTVRLRRGVRGRKAFDPESVIIEPRG